ncbi:S49 family peptidase [Microvirga tunisiensis]|uniref:S49 family peptidase n=1 Tax=Pannonibacter tanglangensis TaxID=2750084 RepID=A0A7X5F350_9HYPH|nr:S49 family peptidase [Pannonibacter sp. XCT-53]NBN78908.1 S49 family peptidase [Pannonibacter sp. XCT-53]
MFQMLSSKLRALAGRSGPVIPVVRLQGVIDNGGLMRPGLNLANVATPLERAFRMKKAPAVALVVNSPGGSAVQSRLITRRIRDLAAEHGKHVLVFVEDVAASGGYMIAVAGDEIIVDPSSIVGSIGVIFSGFGFTGLIDRIGVERRVYTAGSNKSQLDPFRPENPDEIAHIRQLQLEIHEVFIDLVKERRGGRLADHPDLFTGQFWAGRAAVGLGLADREGDLRSVVREKYGARAELRLVNPPRGLFGRRNGGGVAASLLPATYADDLMAAVEARTLWSRYGL